jgi:hypothetical protein
MAQRLVSRAVEKAKRTKKGNLSVDKVGAVAAKPPASLSGSKAKGKASGALKGLAVKKPKYAKHAKKDSASVEVKAAKAKPAASRRGKANRTLRVAPPANSRAVKAKATNMGSASVEVKAARPGGEAKETLPLVQRAASRAAAEAKIIREEGTSVGVKPAKMKPKPKPKPKLSRPGGEAKQKPAYLAAELGQPVDHEGEPIGAGSALARSDADLQAYSLQLWRQMQSGGVVTGYMKAIERAGLTIDEIWTAGIIELQPTSSTPDELRRYKQKLLFRANLLEAILSETVADLRRLPGIELTPSDTEI